MFSMIFTVLTKFGLPLMKYIWEKKEAKKLSDKEFGELIMAHMEQRSGAGQTVIDAQEAEDELDLKLKASMAKKNQETL